MKKKLIVFILVVFVLINICLEYSSKHEFAPEDAVVSGTLVKKFKDRKKETKVPAAVFPYDDKYFTIMYISCAPPTKILLTDDFDSYKELLTDENGLASYYLAGEMSEYIYWPELKYEQKCRNLYAFSKKSEKMKCIYSLTEDELVNKRLVFCGGNNDHVYFLKKNNMNETVEVIDYDLILDEVATIDSSNYSDSVDYSLKVNGNSLTMSTLDDDNHEVVRVIDLDTKDIKDTSIPKEIASPVYAAYDANRNVFAFISFSDAHKGVYLYDAGKQEVKSICEYTGHYECYEYKMDIKNGNIMWLQEKNDEGGVLSYHAIMMYNIETGKLEKIEKAFNYNFINDNEFYYYTYPRNTDSYRVNMYKYNMKPE